MSVSNAMTSRADAKAPRGKTLGRLRGSVAPWLVAGVCVWSAAPADAQGVATGSIAGVV